MDFKFNRNYLLEVVHNGTGLVKQIGPPFTLKMSINRSFGKAQNFGRIQIYNLNDNSRTFMRKDINDIGFTHTVTLKAGYGEELSTVLKGSLKLGYSERQGTEYITNLDVSDFMVAYNLSNVSLSFGAGATDRTVLSSLGRSLAPHGIEFGRISSRYTNASFRGSSYSGNAIDAIDELTGGAFMIDNGTLNIIKDDEFIKGTTLVVNSASGLIGKPRIDGMNVSFTMIFEPRAAIRKKVRVDIGDQVFDGDYMIQNIVHAGTISESVGETLTSEITCVPAKYAIGV